MKAKIIYGLDLNADGEDQVKHLLNSTADYVALTKNNQYVGILKKSDGESHIIKELVSQLDSKK